VPKNRAAGHAPPGPGADSQWARAVLDIAEREVEPDAEIYAA
jgi:hypothetical protein